MNIAVKAFLRGLLEAPKLLELEVEPKFYEMLLVEVPTSFFSPRYWTDEKSMVTIFGHKVRPKRYYNGKDSEVNQSSSQLSGQVKPAG